jgi:hypothetical protein
MFRYCSRIYLIENRLFRFGPESALLGQIERISFKKTNSGKNSIVFVSFLLDIGTFVERLWNVYCFDITSTKQVSLKFPQATGQARLNGVPC